MVLKKLLAVAATLGAALSSLSAADYQPSVLTPPVPAREFRGVWIATVANIDWPSRPGLSTAEQKLELIAILDRAAQLKLNAVIFQVRPACDAFYASPIEPWSEYLTGTMGKAPSPFYDPLAFAITEAHRRGLELHAWFNPYRALHKSHTGNISAGHISRAHPELVRSYGEYLWLDPGEREVQDYSLRVVMDVVKRYDIDGVQFDDYFYPDPTGVNRDFQDEASWKKFGVGGSLSRDDWRRENVSTFISRVYTSIKAARPWVKFGISPFGIWRPGNPAQITGSDAYTKFYADSRKWLMNGWVDYFSPQLYWRIESKDQSFPVLLDWWAQQNVKHRHLWPGISAAYALSQEWNTGEIPNQIRLTRKQPGAGGYIFYNASSLLANRNLSAMIENEINVQPALVPASPWSGSSASGRPSVSFNTSAGAGGEAIIRPAPGATLRWWLVQTRTDNYWRTELMPADESVKPFGNLPPEVIAVTGIDRFGAATQPVVFQKKAAPARSAVRPGINRRF